MIYEIGMLCKHFKGKDLLEKNIYRIEQVGVKGVDIDESLITYTGDNELKNAINLVVYSNIFQEGKLFCREYEDIASELSVEKQNEYGQNIRVEPLTEEEKIIVESEEFRREKEQLVQRKYSK